MVKTQRQVKNMGDQSIKRRKGFGMSQMTSRSCRVAAMALTAFIAVDGRSMMTRYSLSQLKKCSGRLINVDSGAEIHIACDKMRFNWVKCNEKL